MKGVGRDPAVLAGTLRQVRGQQAKAGADLQSEQRALGRELSRHQAALRKLIAAGEESPAAATRLAELDQLIGQAEQRLTKVADRLAKVQAEAVEPEEVASALTSFGPVWEQLGPREQARVLQLLVERVAYDGAAGAVSITFHPSGIKAVAKEREHEVAA